MQRPEGGVRMGGSAVGGGSGGSGSGGGSSRAGSPFCGRSTSPCLKATCRGSMAARKRRNELCLQPKHGLRLRRDLPHLLCAELVCGSQQSTSDQLPVRLRSVASARPLGGALQPLSDEVGRGGDDGFYRTSSNGHEVVPGSIGAPTRQPPVPLECGAPQCTCAIMSRGLVKYS